MKVVVVTLASGEEVQVHEARAKDMSVFLRGLPAMMTLSRAFKGVDFDSEVIPNIDISDQAFDGIWPLLAAMTDKSEEEVRGLPIFDGVALIQALGELTPSNFFRPKESSSSGGNGSQELQP